MATVGDVAKAERVTDRFVGWTMWLAYLLPEVLERLLLRQEPPAVTVNGLIDVTYPLWTQQFTGVFTWSSFTEHLLSAP